MKTPIYKKILQAWYVNKEKEGEHMTVKQIAIYCYGESIFQNKKYSNAQNAILREIRTNIPYAINRATELGIFISVKRKSTALNPEKKFQIEGWRIFVKGEDERFLVDEFNVKKEAIESRSNSLQKFKENIIDRGLMPKKEQKKLFEINQ